MMTPTDDYAHVDPSPSLIAPLFLSYAHSGYLDNSIPFVTVGVEK